jgi:hypothetical protein
VKLSEAMLRKAHDDATATVEKLTTLRGDKARRVAAATLDAGGQGLRAEHAIRLGAAPGPSGIVGAVVVLALDAVVYSTLAAGRRPTYLRPVAAAAVAGRVALFAYAQYRSRAIRKQIRAQLAHAPQPKAQP